MTDIAGERAALAAQGLTMRLREEWGARFNYTTANTVEAPARWFFFHIAVVNPTSMDATQRTIENIGIARFPSTGYSYNAAVWPDGTLLEGQPLTRRGAHTLNDKKVPGFPSNLNYAGRSLVLPQNIQHEVTDAQIHSAARWAAAQIRAGLALDTAVWFGHRDFAAKDCPGGNGYSRLGELNGLTRHYVTTGFEGDDMPLNDADKAYIRDIVLHIIRAEGVSGAGDLSRFVSVIRSEGVNGAGDAAHMLRAGYDAAVRAAVNEELADEIGGLQTQLADLAEKVDALSPKAPTPPGG